MLIAKLIKQENYFCHPRSSEAVPTAAGQKVDKALLRRESEHVFVDLFIPCNRQKKPFSVLATYFSMFISVKQFQGLLIYILRVNRLPLPRLHSPQPYLSDTQPLQ